MDKSTIVSVRIPEAELRKLQLLAQVYERSVGELIRVAVSKHIEELTRTEEFKTKGLELHRRNEQMLTDFLESSGAVSTGSLAARGNPRTRSASNSSKLSIVEPTQASDVPCTLVRARIYPKPEHAQLGAAASHKTSSPPQRQKRFDLVWKQDSNEWILEGFSLGRTQEFVLSSRDKAEPRFITWKSLVNALNERLELKTSDAGRILVCGLDLTRAVRRIEAIQNAGDGAAQAMMLPMVHLESADDDTTG